MHRLLTAIVILIALAATGCGSSNDTKSTSSPAASKSSTAASTSASGNVNVVMKEFTIDPAPTSAPAGKVTFAVKNEGKVKHEFVVVKTSKAADELLKGEEADEAGNVGEIGDLPPGSSKNLSMMLKAGHYVLLCNLPGHYKAGQHHDFTVN